MTAPIQTEKSDSQRLRALFVVNRYNDNGANGICLRLLQFCKHLDRGRIEPHLLAINPIEVRKDPIQASFAGFQTVELPELQRSPAGRLWDAITLSPRMIYKEVSGLNPALAAEVARIGAHLVVEVGGSLMQSLDERLLGVPLICDLVDSPALYFQRLLSAPSQTPTTPAARLRAQRILRVAHSFQEKSLKRARAIIVASEEDEKSVRSSLPAGRLIRLTNGVDTEYFSPASPENPVRNAEVVFEGNMQYAPNVDAALWLVREILPLLRVHRPGIRVRIVGKDPAPEVRALACEDVEVTGTVPDVRDHVRGATAFVCPMRLGAGIKNKVLQAWALGVPVVATPASIAGLDATPGKHFLLAPTPESFVMEIGRVLDDPALATRLAAEARQHVLSHYSWASRGQELARLLPEFRSG